MEKLNEIKNIDIKEQYQTLLEIVNSFLKSYNETTSAKIRLIDSFIVFAACVFIIQFLYIIFTGLFPMNSVLSGLICCIGTITLTGKINLSSFSQITS
jgi:oligosaccharyltransferase complex subunit epsilon